jgi:hypothetical protein
MGRVRVAHLALVLFVCSPAGAAVAAAQQPGQPSARSGNEPYQETQRGPAHSVIEVSIADPGFATTVVLLKAVYDIATERGFAYAFAVPAPGAAASPSGGQGVARLKVFMTKDRETPLRTLLGADYSEQAQGQFDREGWTSVSQLARMFEAGSRGGLVNDPLSDLIGVFSLRADGDPNFRVSKTGPDYFVESRGPAGWSKPVRLVAMTDAERAKAAKSGINASSGLRMIEGSADQQFDILRIEEPLPGSGRTVILHVVYSWFGPNLLYKLP